MLASDGATVALRDVTVRTTGSSSSSDDSSFYGLDAGVLAYMASTITETGGSVTTSGAGANGVFAYGTESKVTISGTKITATGQYAHGIMASGGGSILASGLTVNTAGGSSAAVATDRGGGTITVSGGTYTTTGATSPGIYSTGVVSVTGGTYLAKASEAVVVEGANSVTVTNASLTGSANRGVMLYQSFSGDASGSSSTYTQTGGSLTALAGPLFFITNDSATINLNDVTLQASSRVLLDAAAASWGTSGSNGGSVILNAVSQKLAGSVVADKFSTVTLHLSKASTLTGAVNAADTAKMAALSLDPTSSWTVTATSHLSTLTGLKVSGSTIINIYGNGHTVYYQSSANPYLGGKTYTLASGGTLTPA